MRSQWDRSFVTGLFVIGGLYVLLIVAMLAANATFTTPAHLLQALDSQEIRYAIWLSLISCAITAILSVWVAVPLGYVLSRYRFPGKGLIDVLVDIPVVLPPLALLAVVRTMCCVCVDCVTCVSLALTVLWL